ncbi:MAG: hypothetical protein PHG04_03080, partial [Candidatus Nanoarchaeia archaeon]|nr:hypothetical protein [Candidatus Nanoarchaeia archaeon]
GKMLKIKKSNGDNETYPLLVADYNCPKCKKSIHIKWSDITDDFNLVKCPDCSGDLRVSVFLGSMKGFVLKTVCFSCYSEIGQGNVGGFQK